MPLLVGIDEAGYGPTLGPLVVGATLWRSGKPGIDCWKALSRAVAREGGREESRLVVGDSKAVFDRKRGICTLERSVLAFARCADCYAGTLGEMLERLGCPAQDLAGFVPWYRDLSRAVPRDPTGSACEGAAARLRAAMMEARLECVGLRARVVTEDAFNHRLRQTRNKANIVVEAVLGLIAWATSGAGSSDVFIHVDRLGGRTDYRPLLAQAFPGRHVHVLDISEARSAYRLATADSDWTIEFAIDGDRLHMPVALASMTAKYIREALMEQFNDWWGRVVPGVEPTAGYHTDAQRFLRDIEASIPSAGVSPDVFVRHK